MEFKATHPDEPALHRELRDALNRGLDNTAFFVWIRVTPTGERRDFAALDRIVAETNAWLRELDPDAVRAESLPEKQFLDKAAEVRIQALPKKESARGKVPGAIVGNPEPVLVGWG